MVLGNKYCAHYRKSGVTLSLATSTVLHHPLKLSNKSRGPGIDQRNRETENRDQRNKETENREQRNLKLETAKL